MTRDSGVRLVRRGERLLAACLQPVVELLGHPRLELGHQRLGVQAGHQQAHQPAHPPDLVEVGEQGRPGAGVLHLDGDLATVVPDGPVHLANGRGCRGLVVEAAEPLAPAGAQLLLEHGVHGARGERGCRLLQPGEGLAVGTGEVLGQRRLEHRHRLAELHRPALELAEDPEELLGGAGLHLRGDDLGGPAAEPAPEAPGGPAGIPERQSRELGRASHGATREIIHVPIVAELAASL
jgi:hypothetical protein